MVVFGRSPKMSSTYQSFADQGPTYSNLDLSRARSDESLYWSAGEEAAYLVAELRASLDHHQQRNQHSLGGDDESLQLATLSRTRSRSFTELCCGEEVVYYHRSPPKGKGGPMGLIPGRRDDLPPSGFSSRSRQTSIGSLGGSWRSLNKLGRPLLGPSAKKVSPPTVPDGGGGNIASCSVTSTCSSSSNRHSGSSFSSGVFSAASSSSSTSSGDQRASYSSSVGEMDSMPPPSPRSPVREPYCDVGVVGGVSCDHQSSNPITSVRLGVTTNGAAMSTESPSHYQNGPPQFSFPSGHQSSQFTHLICPKISPGSPHHLSSDGSYTYLPYQSQTSMEDQGIDVQSPGRSSPGSGSGSSTTGSTTSSGNCRNSTTSLDSGRASSSTHTHGHRLSGHSYDSHSILRHSYHSSSSSLGSMEQDGTTHINIHELIKNGVPDAEVLRAWLSDLHFEEYYDKFLTAGYDMPTISRMTPEDLNAVGITKPAHRKRLKSEINKLNISDGLPDFIPSRVEEWLSLLRLDEYSVSLKQQNYNTVQQMTQITWEDLEDVGITKLGHQKKVMLAIKRAKDIMAGKKFNADGKQTPVIQYPPQEIIIARETNDTYANLADLRTFGAPNQYGHDQRNRLSCLDNPNSQYIVPPGNNQSFTYMPMHPSEMQYRYPGAFAAQKVVVPQGPIHYQPDVVAVQLRPSARNKSDEPIYGTYHTFLPPQGPLRNASTAPQRSFDDGDITPTNEMGGVNYEGGATLPRPRAANKYRPVAKVTAKTRAEIHEVPLFAKEKHPAGCAPATGSHSTNNTPQGTPKKLPPPPPRRSNSISESSASKDKTASQYACHRKTLSYAYMGVKGTIQPDVTPDLPPPPPAPQDSGNHQHLPEDFPPPPPPLTCITMTNSAVRGNDSTGVQSQQSVSSDLFRPRRNESNSSFKSTSSSDSGESLPFANDNAGTIKQRVTPRPPHSGFSLIEASRSPRSSPRSSPALRRKEGIVLPNLRRPPSTTTPNSDSVNSINSPPDKPSNGEASSPEATKDVLNDIGNMLANLTDELDAMLEQDLSVKD